MERRRASPTAHGRSARAGIDRLHAVDVIGEPSFSAPSRPALEAEAHAGWLDEVLAGRGVERACFVGPSLGGRLALDDANRRPAKVDRLALICPADIGRQKNFLFQAAPLLLLGPWVRGRRSNWCSAVPKASFLTPRGRSST